MLLSHKYRFIFIKTHKTAGTSIEVDLSKFMDLNDIVTPIFPGVEGHIPRNFHRRPMLWVIRRDFFNHITAERVRHYVGGEIFEQYFKFCVEREPVDKCVSHFSMLRNSPNHSHGFRDITWEGYVKMGDFPIDVGMYTGTDGSLIVDKILRYENLRNELNSVIENFGFNFTGLKSHAKTGFREKIEVTRQQRMRIYDKFRQSNLYTGYSL